MGLFDFLKGGKDFAAQYAKLAENGNVDKLIKLASNGKTVEQIKAAFAAIATMKPNPDLIKCAMDALKGDNSEIRLAAAQALSKIATKPQTEQLLHYAEVDADEQVKAALKAAAVAAKERTPRW